MDQEKFVFQESTNLLVIAVGVAPSSVTVVYVATGRVPDSAPEIRARALAIKAGRSALLRVLAKSSRKINESCTSVLLKVSLQY